MNRTEFIVATALILFAVFALGWFASWLVYRSTRVTHADVGELDRMAGALHDAEETRDQALVYLDAREKEFEGRVAAAEAELGAARDDLGDARREVADLRAWIETRHPS